MLLFLLFLLRFFLVLLPLGPVLGCATVDTSAKSPAMAAHEAGPSVGLSRMVFDEFHSLSRATMERSAVPWKGLAAAMLLHHRRNDPRLPVTEASFIALLQRRYGFIVPTRVENWPSGQSQPEFNRPIGMLQGTLTSRLPASELELTNLGCSTCHSANLYDASGNPTRVVWVGLPSGSIDLGRFGDDAYQAFGYATHHIEETMAVVEQAFPRVSTAERETLRRVYLPEAAKKLDRLASTLGGLTPHSNGSPGLTNGVATLKLYLGAIDGNHRDASQVAFTSIPDLGGLRVRPSILWDSVYAPPGWSHTGPFPAGLTLERQKDAIAGIVSVVTIGTTGVTPSVAVSNIPRIRDTVAWMVDDYRPPPFPGPLDVSLARRGGAVFARHCARCHGEYQESATGLRLVRFPNVIIPADVIDTDATRAEAPGPNPNSLFAKTAIGAHLDARTSGGYAAVPLTSLWATAPYLHNGSLPTLWHLMHPHERPVRFEVGGHRLNFERVGIDGEMRDGVYRYPIGYRPWMDPEIYDTRAPGRANSGHDDMFDDMTEADKGALLEFLKRV